MSFTNVTARQTDMNHQASDGSSVTSSSSAYFTLNEGQQQRSSAGPIRDTRSNLLASRQISIQPILIKPVQTNTVVRSISVSSAGDSPHLSPTIQMSVNDYKNLLSAHSSTTAVSRSSTSPASSPLPQGSATSVDLLALLATNDTTSTTAAAPTSVSASSPSLNTASSESETAHTSPSSSNQSNANSNVNAESSAHSGPRLPSATFSSSNNAIIAQNIASQSGHIRREPVTRSESHPVSQPLQKLDSLSQPFMQQPRLNEISTDSKKFIEVGKYILFDSNVNNDTLNTAYNSENHCFYTWKKFNKQDYKKKLEPYFIMEGCSEHVYQISEIILNHETADKNAVYVMFDTYYGDLHTYMKEKKRLGEAEARHIFKQCVQAVQQCHENGIIVRDIKLKKFIFTNPERTKIALTNLEDCLVLDEDAPNDLIRSQQGCPAYVSPEVLNSQQAPYSGMLSDSWSLGIVLFTLLFGRYPFHHQVITSMFARIARAKFQIPPSSGLSADAKILLRSLIRLKPSERLRPFEILAHNWFKQVDDEFNFNLNHSNKQITMATSESKYSTPAWLTSSSNVASSSNFMNAFNAHKPLGMSLSAPNRLLNDARRNQLRRMPKPVEENDDDNCLVPVCESTSEANN